MPKKQGFGHRYQTTRLYEKNVLFQEFKLNTKNYVNLKNTKK